MTRSKPTTAAPAPVTSTAGPRKSSRIPEMKLKQVEKAKQTEKEVSSKQTKPRLNKASKSKIAKSKARKLLLDQVISFRKKLVDPVLESEPGGLLKQILDHQSDEGLKIAINKVDFSKTIAPSTTSRKRGREGPDPNVKEVEKPTKKPRLTKVTSTKSDRLIIAPRSRRRAKAINTTQSSKVTTTKAVKRKQNDTDDARPSKRKPTAKPIAAKKPVKSMAYRITRSKETIAEAARKRSQTTASSPDQEQLEAVVHANATPDVDGGGEVASSADKESLANEEAHNVVQAQALAVEAKEDDTPSSQDQEPAQADAGKPTDDLNLTLFLQYGIVMRLPGASYGDTLDIEDPTHRSMTNRHLDTPELALTYRIMALIGAPLNKRCEANNWTIVLPECTYAYEGAADTIRSFLRDESIALTFDEPWEYQNYFHMSQLWKSFRDKGIGLFLFRNHLGEEDIRFSNCGPFSEEDAIGLFGRHHGGDETESGLKARLDRLQHATSTDRNADWEHDPLDGTQIQYGDITYSYTRVWDPRFNPNLDFED